MFNYCPTISVENIRKCYFFWTLGSGEIGRRPKRRVSPWSNCHFLQTEQCREVSYGCLCNWAGLDDEASYYTAFERSCQAAQLGSHCLIFLV
ncbi:hypothetical protein CEXT_104701 [Caerostris extrusa]|uniref:Uncharacterized protein n=1 Tax=Caerostris extrusa TaxID=172846 RepID=A0AAV4MM86_CAEEX|nr:hypothetical protein CEXT_104701 [Caerostris extrusa]